LIIKDLAKVDVKYLAYTLKDHENKIVSLSTGGTFKEVSKTNLSKLSIPLPDLNTQRKIVEIIETQSNLIEGNKKLAMQYMNKMSESIDEIWGD
jgi:restriction endonuclease S subunit